MTMKPLNQFLEEIKTKRIKPENKNRYSDEHAHVLIWNHMLCVKDIADDTMCMEHELNQAKLDDKHPLNFKNAATVGFCRGRKTTLQEGSYYEELSRAIKSVGVMYWHPGFEVVRREKWPAHVMGTAKGELSLDWKVLCHGAAKAVSKADIRVQDPNDSSRGMSISLKKSGDSSLMSAGHVENVATHSIALKHMFQEHPDYKDLPDDAKNEIYKGVMYRLDNVTRYLSEMVTTNDDARLQAKESCQYSLDLIHEKEHPALTMYLRREAATGRGKFEEGSPAIAEYILKTYSSDRTKGGPANIKHVDQIDWSIGPKPRAALPKGKKGRKSGNVRLDELYERKRKNG